MYKATNNVVDHAADNGNTSAIRATTPAQQGRQHHHIEGNDASTKMVTMPAQLTSQRNKDNNAGKVVDAAVECGYNYLRLLLYAN